MSEAYIRDVGIDVGCDDLQADCSNCDTHDRAHIMRFKLEAKTLDDDANRYKYGSRNGRVQATLRVYITIM